jgi:hypothetical protein
MSNKTIVLSIPTSTFNNNGKIAEHLFNQYVNACETAGIVLRYEPYDSDIYHELNLKALDIEKSHALNELEEEILNNVACVGGSCED